MAESTVREIELLAEVQRLRLLLQRVTVNAKKKTQAMSFELEPAPHGFRLVMTGVSPDHEVEMGQIVADCLNALLKGSIRFSLHSWDVWKAEKEWQPTVTALAAPEEHEVPARDEPEAEDAVDPHDGGTLA